MGGFFDTAVSDKDACKRVWTMFVRCGFAPGAHVADIDDDQEDDDMGGKRITDEERAEILRRHGEGEQFNTIAESLERSPSFVSGVVKAAGSAPPTRTSDAGPEPVKRAPRPPREKPAQASSSAIVPARKPLAKASTGSPLEAIRAERDRLRSAADALDAALGLLE